jgi:bla regulator protein BlaR1
MTVALINHLWQSTLFCAAVWLITLALRSNGAALRHALWLTASIKFLVPFSALYELGALAGLSSPVDAQPALLSQAVKLAGPVISPTQALLMPGPASVFGWTQLLAFAWIAGAATVATRWWLAWRAAGSMARAARPAPGSPPDVRVVDSAVEPAVARVFRPVVLLPAALPGRLSPAQLGAILAHERHHIARRDNLIAHVQRMVETLFWFHPLVWWIGRRLVDERERACDEAVLRAGHEPGDYAEGILAVCGLCRHERLPVAASALSGNLTRRIRGIITDPTPVAPGFCKTVALSTCALAIAGVPLLSGAFDGAIQKYQQLVSDMRAFRTATITIAPTAKPGETQSVITAAPRAIAIHNTSLRELVALSYGVSAAAIEGGGLWLDVPRYDIRAELRDALSDPDDFEPAALRGAVIELLASRFDLRVHVNQRCEAPCGRRAVAPVPGSS